MLPKVVSACSLGLLLALTSSAAAGGTWVEVDDAPERPAAFFGTTSALFDPNGTASFDPRLWLFNLDGTPVLGNDDAPGDASFQFLLTDLQSNPGPVASTTAGTDTIALNGATFDVPGPGVGTLVVVGVIGLVGRTRRRRFHA